MKVPAICYPRSFALPILCECKVFCGGRDFSDFETVAARAEG